jgi:hypothetical protein
MNQSTLMNVLFYEDRVGNYGLFDMYTVVVVLWLT